MYFLPYLFICFVLWILFIREQELIRKRLSPLSPRLVAVFILLIFLGLRGFIYSDFVGYYKLYEKTPTIFSLKPIYFDGKEIEYGFLVYTSVIKTFGFDYFGWIFISTLIDIIVLYHTFKRYSISAILPFIFFISFHGVLMEVNLLRNMKAIDLFLLSIPYLQKKKILPYLILNFTGMLFHLSSAIYVIAYFVLTFQLPLWVYWMGIIGVNIIYLLQIPVLGDLFGFSMMEGSLLENSYGHYVDGDMRGTQFSVHYFERLFSICLFTFLLKRLVGQRISNKIFYNCIWLYYCIYTLCYEFLVLTERIPMLFLMGYWVLYPNTIFLKTKFRKIINIGISILVLLKLYSTLNQKPAEYSNILFGIPNYQIESNEAQKELPGHQS